MSPKVAQGSKSSPKRPVKLKRNSSNKKRSDSSPLADITLSKLVNECCSKLVTSPRMLTHRFLHTLLGQLNNLANREKSQARIGAINQISFDLNDFISSLNLPCRENDRPNQDNVFRKMSLDLKILLLELKNIDSAIQQLTDRRTNIFEQLESTYCSNINLTVDENSYVVDSRMANDEEAPCSNANTNSNQASRSEPSCNQYFDGTVVSAAALSSQRVLSVKQEHNISIEKLTCVNVNKFTEYTPSHLLMVDDVLLCACANGTIVRFSFKGCFIPHIPHRTNIFNICDSPIAGMLFWNNSLILSTISGTIIKCTMRCKIVKDFSLNEEACGMSEIQGLLYVATKSGKLFIINLRSLTLFKDPVELGYSVKTIKSCVFQGSNLIVCLSEKGEAIGTSITDNYIGSAVFKFVLPAIRLFDIGSYDQTPSIVNFYCASTRDVTCLHLQDGGFTEGKSVHVAASAMLVCEHLVFLGSETGDIMIINHKNTNTYSYNGITQGKILSLAYLSSILYIGAETGVYCLCIESNQDVAVEL